MVREDLLTRKSSTNLKGALGLASLGNTCVLSTSESVLTSSCMLFRQLPSLVGLETLHMRDTQRSLANLPSSLETLTCLQDLDLSFNDMPKVPDALYTLPSLRRLNLSNNAITELAMALGKYNSSLKTKYVRLFIHYNVFLYNCFTITMSPPRMKL